MSGSDHDNVVGVIRSTAPRRYARRNHSDSGAHANFSIEPSKFLVSLVATSATAVTYDMNCRVVSLIGQRRHHAAGLPSILEVARNAQVTLTRALTLRAGLAESHHDIASAHRLVRTRYAWRGYDIPEANRNGTGAPDFERNVVFIAKNNGAIVGTITLGLDREEGLLAEHTYPEAIQAKREEGGVVCEVTRLAVAEDADSKPVLAALFSLAYATASARGVTDVFIEVTPRHAAFYSRALGFRIASKGRVCQRVGVQSALLWLEMDELEQRLMTLNARVFPQPECRAA
ncbi:MAG TPA: hypothetical protein VFB54_16245 [Burkholderiales bacterium]|nr:hypothetical protein [Burkholderiales bacterium]